MKYRNIVIAGDVGTGATTLATALAEKLGWKFISTGEFFRSYALENDLKLWDKESVPDEVDRRVDQKFLELMRSESGYIFDTHYGAYFTRDMPDIFKILLTCDRSIATQRMLSRESSHHETAEEIEKRRAGLYAKFRKLYGKDNYEDPKFFNLVIDTSTISPEKTLETALGKIL